MTAGEGDLFLDLEDDLCNANGLNPGGGDKVILLLLLFVGDH